MAKRKEPPMCKDCKAFPPDPENKYYCLMCLQIENEKRARKERPEISLLDKINAARASRGQPTYASYADIPRKPLVMNRSVSKNTLFVR